jgi:hypothetical protein
MTAILYPREVVCGSCGIAMFLSWYAPFGRGSEQPIYQHPDHIGCEFNGKKLKPTGSFAGLEDEVTV